MNIRKQTARNLALAWAEHAPEFADFVDKNVITVEVLEAAKRVHAFKADKHANAKTKASRVMENKARMLVRYFEQNVNLQK